MARAVRGERIGQPRPGDLRKQGIGADVEFEGSLREGDDPPGAAP
jgi:hypothetical protein